MRESYGIPRDRITLRVNCHLNNGLTLGEIESYWLEVLDLPRSSLRAVTVDRVSKYSKRRARVLPFGTVSLRVNSVWLAQSIYGAIQE